MPEVLASGRFLRLVRRDGWEWAERTNTSGVVVIAALTPAGEVLLVEQERLPVGARVLEMPAGLAGDVAGAEDEALAEAARRELVEETGWDAERMEEVTSGPVSAGMTSESFRVRVECYAGYRGEETPRRFEIGQRSSVARGRHLRPLMLDDRL